MEDKCQYDMCVHTPEDHKDGSCMHITQPEIKDKPTMDKFCPCGAENGLNLRLYSKVGFVEPEFRDSMVTSKCWCCGEDVLMRVDQVVCIECQHWLGLI